MNKDKLCKAAKETNVILQHMPIEYLNKVPNNFKKFLNNIEDKEYDYSISKKDGKLNVMDETASILSLIYRQYWCDPHERTLYNKILMENQNEKKHVN